MNISLKESYEKSAAKVKVVQTQLLNIMDRDQPTTTPTEPKREKTKEKKEEEKKEKKEGEKKEGEKKEGEKNSEEKKGEDDEYEYYYDRK